jgi:UDP-glucuronate 4-epimerase
MTMLENQRILIAGPTSQVAKPLLATLARNNTVYGLARFTRQADRDEIEALGATTIAADLAEDSLDAVPDDLDYVINMAVVKSGDFDYDLRANAEGVGMLMKRCSGVKAFLHCSTAGVYDDAGHAALKESDPLGDNHRVMMPTYSISKIAAENVVRFAARAWSIPTTIARFSVPYGNNGGWPWYHLMMMKSGAPIPVHVDRPCEYNLIHEDDYIAMVPGMLGIASTPATTINWGGSEPTDIETWCTYIGELTGLEPKFNYTEDTLRSVKLDPTLMHARVGQTQVSWRDGIKRMIEALNPELMQSA